MKFASISHIKVTDLETHLSSLMFDVSEANGGEPFDTLSDALTYADSVLLASQKKGGMTIKYVQSSDNKYVQYRLMSSAFNTTPANWQGVDDTPTLGSKNLVTSRGVYNSEQRIKVLLNEINFIDLFSVDKGYITKAGIISVANTSNYKRTTYIDVERLKGYVVTLCSNGSGNCIAFADNTYGVVGYINETVSGYHTYNINDELLENYPTATRIVLATTDGRSGIKLDNSYDEIQKKINTNTQGILTNVNNIATNSQSIEAINNKVGQIDAKVNSNEERVVFNDPDSIGTWNNTNLSGIPYLQKVDSEYYGRYAYGFKFLQRDYTAEVLRLSLVTCNDETVSSSSVFTQYKYSYYTLTEDNANKVTTIMFNDPVFIKDNSYIRILGAPTSAGGTGGNGKNVTARYNHSGTKVIQMPFSAIQFAVYNNQQLGLGVIVGEDSIPTRLDKMQDEIDDSHTGEMKRDIFYGSEIFTIPNGIRYDNGAELVSASLYHSDYIPLGNAEYISFPCAYGQSEPVGAAFYDKDKNFIGGVQMGNIYNYHYYNKYPIKENYPNAVYAIFHNKFFSQYYNVRLYKASDKPISDDYIFSYRRGAALWIPSKLYCVVGRTLQIFKRSILYANNIDNFRISISVVSGTNRFTNYKEYFEYSPVNGDTNVVCNVRCTNLIEEVLATKEVTFVPVAVPTSPSNTKNILFIGDSWTQAIYPSEVARMLTGSPVEHQSSVSDCQFPTALNLTNINFIGTNNKSTYNTMPWREGASGQTLAYHLGSNSPFYRDGAIDFTKYMNSGDVRGTIADPQTGDKIDICVIIHGRNEEPKMGEIKTIIDKLKEHNPNIIILFGFDMIRATNNNSELYGQCGIYSLEDMFERLIATLYTNVYLLPVQCGLDTRYNMVYQEKAANYRNTKFTDVVNNPANIYHPNNNGYCELADVVFYELSAFI